MPWPNTNALVDHLTNFLADAPAFKVVKLRVSAHVKLSA